MVQFNLNLKLPNSSDLPCSADIPVDNEIQNFIPNFLLFLLEFIWQSRQDWFFAVDMGLYHTTGINPLVPIVPDGFLSLGVARQKGGNSRSSYVVWEENNIVPILALEVVSKTPGGEYEEKMQIYAGLGIRYYIIYNPDYWQRDRHQPLEIYDLVNGQYELQVGEPFWMAEIGLGIGRTTVNMGGLNREILSWYDHQNVRYLTPEELLQQTQKQLEQYRRRFGELQ
jgi:Uma2 family endonuclease